MSTESTQRRRLGQPTTTLRKLYSRLLLAAARTSFVGWPLHPVAYALSASWSIHVVWTPMLIAWISKSAVLRYGGLRMYRRAVPFFYGLILGQSIVGCAWSLTGLAFRIPTYSSYSF